MEISTHCRGSVKTIVWVTTSPLVQMCKLRILSVIKLSMDASSHVTMHWGVLRDENYFHCSCGRYQYDLKHWAVHQVSRDPCIWALIQTWLLEPCPSLGLVRVRFGFGHEWSERLLILLLLWIKLYTCSFTSLSVYREYSTWDVQETHTVLQARTAFVQVCENFQHGRICWYTKWSSRKLPLLHVWELLQAYRHRPRYTLPLSV